MLCRELGVNSLLRTDAVRCRGRRSGFTAALPAYSGRVDDANRRGAALPRGDRVVLRGFGVSTPPAGREGRGTRERASRSALPADGGALPPCGESPQPCRQQLKWRQPGVGRIFSRERRLN